MSKKITGKANLSLKIQRNSIKLQDGTDVYVGMVLYRKESLQPAENESYSKKYPNAYYPKFTGKPSVKFSKHTVISVNESSISRSFTIRSIKGCEHTYTVKNTCIGTLYGNLESVQEAHEEKLSDDISKLFDKIKFDQISLKKEIKSKKDREKKFRKTIKKLNKSKPVFCDC